jgi:hypothetical protein
VTVAGDHCRQDRIGRARENTMAAAGGEKQAKKDANKRRYDRAAVGGDACVDMPALIRTPEGVKLRETKGEAGASSGIEVSSVRETCFQ